MKVLMMHPDRCTGCRNCELACSFKNHQVFRPIASRVHVFGWERDGISVPMMCQQCDHAACVEVCPTGALTRNPATGVVEWDAKRCIRCKMCVMACPFGNITYISDLDAILKCNLCGGDPECVKFCPSKALEFVDDTVSTRSREKAFAEKFKKSFDEVK